MEIRIPFQALDFVIEPLERIELPVYKGSTFRGGFGNAFKRVSCTLSRRTCGECLLKTNCAYAYIFETEAPKDKSFFGIVRNVPHPFVIEPPEELETVYNEGKEINFGLILIGRAKEYLPYFIYSFEELGKMGIGRGRGRYILKMARERRVGAASAGRIVYSGASGKLKAGQGSEITIADSLQQELQSDLARHLTIKFITPPRIVTGGRLTDSLDFRSLVINLLRRLCGLYIFHCGGDISEFNHKDLIERAGSVSLMESDLAWYDWERYSSRQKTKMKLGGFVGSIVYSGDARLFTEILNAGETLHVGKGTSFGLGKYRMVGD